MTISLPEKSTTSAVVDIVGPTPSQSWEARRADGGKRTIGGIHLPFHKTQVTSKGCLCGQFFLFALLVSLVTSSAFRNISVNF